MKDDKDYISKKKEYLEVALELFHEKGYDKTTVQEIIDNMGVSKGAFYHYFKSKEDVLTAIAEEYSNAAIRIIESIANDQEYNAIEKINKLIEAVNTYKGSREKYRAKMKSTILAEKNPRLEKKIMDAIKPPSVKLFQQILDQAVTTNYLDQTDTEELAIVLLHNIHDLNAAIDSLISKYQTRTGFDSDNFIKELESKLEFYEKLFDRIVGFKSGSIKLKESYLRRFTNY